VVPKFDDDPQGVPLERVGRLGITWVLDNNLFKPELEPVVESLFELRAEGWITLKVTDTQGVDLSEDANEARRTTLAAMAADFAEIQGPFVWGHSRFSHALWGDNDDQARIAEVFGVMHPHKVWKYASKNDQRDALYVANAVRYGADGFITFNRAGLLNRSAEIAAAYDGFRVMHPEVAVRDATRFRNRYLERRLWKPENP